MTGPTVLFIGGLGRSGSTLVELLLAAAPGWCAIGEVVHVWDRALVDNERCGCGAPFRECAFWTAVGERAFGGWSHVSAAEVLALKAKVDRTRYLPLLAGSRLPPRRRAATARYGDLYRRVYEAAAATAAARVVVDSSKHASLAYALRWTPGLDLRILHVVRDAPAVAHSWARRVRRPEVTGRVAHMPVLSPARASGRWLVQNAAFDLLGRWTPVLRVRYEDFVADPDATLAAIRAFAGAPAPPPEVGRRPVAHSVAGNPVRFADGPLTVRPDEAWRHTRRGRRWLVGLATIGLRARYGYLRRPAGRT